MEWAVDASRNIRPFSPCSVLYTLGSAAIPTLYFTRAFIFYVSVHGNRRGEFKMVWCVFIQTGLWAGFSFLLSHLILKKSPVITCNIKANVTAWSSLLLNKFSGKSQNSAEPLPYLSKENVFISHCVEDYMKISCISSCGLHRYGL